MVNDCCCINFQDLNKMFVANIDNSISTSQVSKKISLKLKDKTFQVKLYKKNNDLIGRIGGQNKVMVTLKPDSKDVLFMGEVFTFGEYSDLPVIYKNVFSSFNISPRVHVVYENQLYWCEVIERLSSVFDGMTLYIELPPI